MLKFGRQDAELLHMTSHALAIAELSILLVEPSAMQARLIARHLQEEGVAHVDCLASGGEALPRIRSLRPDLVISAMYLPDMTGAELVRAMRGEAGIDDIPFMLISSETSFDMLDQVRQAGVIAILPKPFQPADLHKALLSTIEFVAPDEAMLAEVSLDDLKALVVDDSALARKHIVRVLQNLGIEDIVTAADGSEAVTLIEENFFDLVVTDYNMPEMDGEKLTRYIREHSSQRSIPILMVTSEGDSNRLSAVQQAGVSGICDKPFDPLTVKQMIRNLLS